jgi:acyl-CoA thioesterase I
MALVRPQIVALGDSLTSGHGIGELRSFPSILQSRIDAEGFDYSVVNAGVSRNTSSHALQRLETALAGDVRILIVAVGANDGLRRVPVAQLNQNLTRIIETAQSRRIAVILCAMEALPIYGRNYVTSFRAVYDDLAARFRIPLVPFVMTNILGNRRLVLPDQVHPNAEGARMIADTIWPHLQPLLKRVRVAR